MTILDELFSSFSLFADSGILLCPIVLGLALLPALTSLVADSAVPVTPVNFVRTRRSLRKKRGAGLGLTFISSGLALRLTRGRRTRGSLPSLLRSSAANER